MVHLIIYYYLIDLFQKLVKSNWNAIDLYTVYQTTMYDDF